MSLDNILKDAIEKTELNPVIKWNDPSWAVTVDKDPMFSRYMNNVPIENNDNKRCHGYFALLHNIVSALPDSSVICELGNREGLSTMAILDSMKPNDKFVSIDTIPDLRFVPPDLANPLVEKEVFLPLISDCLSEEAVDSVQIFTNNKKIDLLFCDTIHTYEQIKKEFEVYEPLLSDSAIILVDDIQNDHEHLPYNHPDRRSKYLFFEEWKGEKYDITELCHNPSGFAAFIYRREK